MNGNWGEHLAGYNGASSPTAAPRCSEGSVPGDVGEVNGTDERWPGAAEDEVVEERLRLEAEIAAVSARTAAARARAAARDLEVRAALRDELHAARERLAALERQHEVTVEMIRRAAQDEVDRITARAPEEVAAAAEEETDGE